MTHGDVSITVPARIYEDTSVSRTRRLWKAITFVFTCWIPSPLLKACGMKRRDVRDAWREKVAIFLIILGACFCVASFTIWLPRILCPKQNVLTTFEVQGKNQMDNAAVAAYGRYFEITEIVNDHINKLGVNQFQMQSILGKDVSQMFFPAQNWEKSCPGITNPGASWDNLIERNDQFYWPHMVVNSNTNTPEDYLGFLSRYAKGRIGWPLDYLQGITDSTKKLIVMYGNVYDVAAYFQGQSQPGFFDDNMYKIFTNVRTGQDATALMEQLRQQNPVYYRNVLNCMNNLFYVGIVDNRNSFKCRLSNIILVAASGVIAAVILVKFVSAIAFGGDSNPQQINKYVIVQVPCFTEGKESLEITLNSIAVTEFDDNHKLAVIICDGMVTGKENDKSTPDLVLEILYGTETAVLEAKRSAHPPMTYFAVGEGHRAENKAQIFSGIYAIGGHKLPFIVIVKTGNDNEPKESKRRGNRGKRDSQILLMRFLHHIYARAPLTELEYALYREMNDIMGMSPEVFEYMLMVDADTSVTPDSITKMVHHMIKDKKTVGLCGETFVANEKESWTTMIQVYEYFVSHHLAKAFESLFGSVTCLPGCFCMYRIRTEKNVPLLIAPALIDDYSDSNVNTLHKKNLLQLGEDRYLTTLVLKHFRRYKTRYTSDAQCHTNAPDTWSILLSQRRRWINSTVHNLLELVINIRDLCGFCCFSMRFVVFIDLLSTIVSPSAVLLVGYIIYSAIFDNTQFFMISLIILGAIYGLQMIIILLQRKWEHAMWMIIYIIAMPLFNFVIPLYSFWHMDDFNWGTTKAVINDNGKQLEVDVDDSFDPAIIERKRISEWELEWKVEDEDMPTPVPSLLAPTMMLPSFPPSIYPPMTGLAPMMRGGGPTLPSVVGAVPMQMSMPSMPMAVPAAYHATSSMMPGAAYSNHIASSYVSRNPYPPSYVVSEMLSTRGSVVGTNLGSECYPDESASNVGIRKERRKKRKSKKPKASLSSSGRVSKRSPAPEEIQQNQDNSNQNNNEITLPEIQRGGQDLFSDVELVMENLNGNSKDEWNDWFKEEKQ